MVGQAKTAVLAYGTNEWGSDRATITSNTKTLISNLMSKGYQVVVVPPSPDLVVDVGGAAVRKDPYSAVTTAAAEMGARIYYADYDKDDELGNYVHLNPEHAKSIKTKYNADIVIGDSNALRIQGTYQDNATAVSGARFDRISKLISNVSSIISTCNEP